MRAHVVSLLLCSIVLLGVASSSPARAKLDSASTLHVPAQYPTIQSAIDAAISGHTVIMLADGIYTGPGNVDLDFKGKAIAVTSEHGATSTIIDCQGTSADPHRGFYFHMGETSASRVEGITVRDGYASAGGGMLLDSSSPTITNCVFTKNSVGTGSGGGMGIGFSSPTISNCTFSDNGATGGGGMSIGDYSYPIITHCVFSNNTASLGGGMLLQFSGPTITDCTFSGNSVSGDSGYGAGGGMLVYDLSGPTVTNCTFSDNRASGNGGGMLLASCSTKMTNCTLSNNVSGSGGGMWVDLDTGRSAITNCVIWGNTSPEIYPYSASGTGPSSATSVVTVQNSDILGGYPGMGNIDADPLFVNAASGDLHIKPDSPCLSAGAPIGAPITDLDGNTRPNPPSIGAYELVPVPATITAFTLTPSQINAAGPTVIADVSAMGTFTKVTVSPTPGTLGAASPTFTLANSGVDWTGAIPTAYLRLAKVKPVTFVATGTRVDGSTASATAALTIGPLPSLTLTVGNDKSSVRGNETFTLNGYVRDSAIISAPSTTVLVMLPHGLSCVSSNGFTYNPAANTLTWVGSLMAQSGVRSINILLQASPDAPKQTPLIIKVTASLDGFQAVTQNAFIVVEAGLAPVGVTVNATGGYGLLNGTAKPDPGRGTPPLYATLSPVSSLSNIWLGVDYVTAANEAAVSTSSDISVGSGLGRLGLIAPDAKPTYDATFHSIDSSIAMGVSFNSIAGVMTIASICMQTLDALADYGPAPTTDDFLTVYDEIQEVKAFNDVAQSFDPPPSDLLGEMLAVAGAVRAFANLSPGDTQKIAQIVLKLFGKKVTGPEIARHFKVLSRVGVIFDLLQVLADELTLAIQTHSDEMVVTFRGSPIRSGG